MKKETSKRIINNAPYYNDSLAYDFELFMPREKKVKTVEQPKQKKKTRPRQKFKVDAVTVWLSVLCFTLILSSLFVRVSIVETDAQISKLEQEITALESEKTRLMCEYARITSYANLEEEATKLGMRKATKDQIVYIRVNEHDKVVLANGDVIEVKD